MKQFRFLWVLLLLLVLACKKGDDNDPEPEPIPPTATQLVFPEANSECTTGISISDELSEVTFRWQAAENTELYTLNVVNLSTNIPQTIATTSLNTTLGIAKGTPFSWSITSTNTTSEVVVTSETWLFYNAGAQINYAPFPAQILEPKSGETVQKNENDAIELRWIGADVEDDIVSFELLISTTSPEELATAYLGLETVFSLVGAPSDTIVYWKVITTDAQGNTADSGVYDFKVF